MAVRKIKLKSAELEHLVDSGVWTRHSLSQSEPMRGERITREAVKYLTKEHLSKVKSISEHQPRNVIVIKLKASGVWFERREK